MNESSEYSRETGQSGSILLEINLLLMVIVLASCVYCDSAQAVFKNCKRLLADIKIAQAARFSESILRRELSYNSAQVRLGKDFNDRDELICRKTFKNVRTYWYLNGYILYRKTIKNSTTGINPFSDSEIQITDFRIVPLGNEKLGIVMTFKEPETGLTRKKSFALFLSNGNVIP